MAAKDPNADVTYGSNRYLLEATGRNAVNDFTKNATGDYAQMLADKAAQTEANALPLGGSGIGKLNSAIEASPQLQSGLMAAGLSLMFGGDVETAITTGLGAASNYNQQVTAEEDKKKAEMLAGAKQQSQMEHSYEQGNLMQRQPDSFNVDAARVAAGVGKQQLSADLIKHISDQANENKRLRMQLGLPELPLPVEVASVSGTIGELSRQSDLVLPGMKPGQLDGTTKRVALSPDQKTYLKATYDALKKRGLSQAQIDEFMRGELSDRGMALRYPTVTDAYADLGITNGKVDTKKVDKKAPAPAPKKLQPPKPITPTSFDISQLTRSATAPNRPTNFEPEASKALRLKQEAEAAKQRKLFESLRPSNDAALDALFQTTFK